MNSKLAFVLGLVAGGAVGTVVSWRLLKTKYKKIADEEIESMKEVLAKRMAEQPEEEKCDGQEEEAKTPKVVPEEYLAITKKYTNGEELTVGSDQRPYRIDPEEFGERDNYDTLTLIYYADGVLADFGGEVVEDVGGTVGPDALTRFGENENDPDTVYVRNDVLKYDYEILKDAGKFTDFINADKQNYMED